MLQELGRLDTTGPNKFKYKLATLNAAESSELVLMAQNQKESKNVKQTDVYVMVEMDFEE